MTKSSLVVLDDEPQFCDFVSTVAESVGYKVTIFTDPKLFMDRFSTIGPMVLVLDVVMPGIDGIEIVQWLAQHDTQTHVLLVTGYNPRYAKTAKIIANAKGLASVQTLDKPITASELRNALAALFPTVDSPISELPEGA